MNKQALFTKAHQIARQTVAAAGSYLIAFNLALKQAWAEAKTTVRKLSWSIGTAKNGNRYIEVCVTKGIQEGEVLEARHDLKEGRGRKAPVVGEHIITFTVTGLGKAFYSAGTQWVRCYGDVETRDVRF